MSNRDLGVSALGRFLTVERYRESQQSSLPTQLPRSLGADAPKPPSHDFPASRYARRRLALRS